MCANSASASYDSKFGISIVPADYFTTTSGVTSVGMTRRESGRAIGSTTSAICNLIASSSPGSSRCVASGGAHCGSVSLFLDKHSWVYVQPRYSLHLYFCGHCTDGKRN